MNISVRAHPVAPFASSVLPPLQSWLPMTWLIDQCRRCGLKWRRRHWDPVLTFWACIFSALDSHCSVRAVEQYVDLFRAEPPSSDCDGADFARARLRLPEGLFKAALLRLGKRALDRAACMWGTWKTVLIDGSTLRLPRTAQNIAAFGLAPTGRGKSHLPVLRLLLLVCAETGVVLDAAIGAYQTSERALFRLLADRLEPGLLLIADRGFCSFLALWYVQLRGCQYLGRLHQTRAGKGRALRGRRDYRCCWSRRGLRFTRCAAWAELAPLVTEDLEVRLIECRLHRKGYRPLLLALCTTLLDARLYPQI